MLGAEFRPRLPKPSRPGWAHTLAALAIPLMMVVMEATLLPDTGSGSVAVLLVVPSTDPLVGAVKLTVFVTAAPPAARPVLTKVTRPLVAL